MPVNEEFRLRILASLHEMHLSVVSRVNRSAVNGKPLLKHTKFLKALRELGCDNVLVNLGFQRHLDFESDGDIRAAACEVLWSDKGAYSIRSSSNLLQNFEPKTHRRLSGTVFSHQQDRRVATERQLEILQAPEIVDVETTYHRQTIVRLISAVVNQRSQGNSLHCLRISASDNFGATSKRARARAVSPSLRSRPNSDR